MTLRLALQRTARLGTLMHADWTGFASACGWPCLIDSVQCRAMSSSI